MKRSLLLIGLIAIGISSAAVGEVRPVCGDCGFGETIQSRFQPPEGWTRVTVPAQSFAAWLRQLELLPPTADALDWRGRPAMTADEVAGVLDWRLLGSVEQCADIAVRLIAEFAHGNGGQDLITFRSLSGQAITWTKWLQGNYAIEGGASEIVYRQGPSRRASPEELDAYLKFVMTYVNTASLVRDWPRIDFEEIDIGDVLIQPSRTVNGLGHLSVVLDACTGPAGERLYLLTDGFTPARAPVVREKTPGDLTSVWMTPDEYLKLMSQFGPGAFHRPPAWTGD